MRQRIADYRGPDFRNFGHADGGTCFAKSATDPWMIEVLLETMAVALHVPVWLINSERLDDFVGTYYGGDCAAFRAQLCAGNVERERLLALEQSRSIMSSNSDPFWTIIRGLDRAAQLLLSWLLDERGVEYKAALPAPFGEDFIACQSIIHDFGFRLVAGPVWRWTADSCEEPGVSGRGFTVIRRIEAEFGDAIAEHAKGLSEGKPVDIFSLSRLRRNVMSRPPMPYAALSRCLRFATAALHHALETVVDERPRAAELVCIAIAALHFAERREVGALNNGTEVWHRLETGCRDEKQASPWLITRLDASGAVASSELSWLLRPHPSALIIEMPEPGVDDANRFSFSQVMTDYAMGRNAYFRERMMVLRLWLTDNFARWLTTKNVEEDAKYTRRVDMLAAWIAEVCVADRCSMFRYDAVDRSLDRLGRFSRDESRAADSRKASYQNIRFAGMNPALRETVPSYRALDNGEPVTEVEYSEDPSSPGDASQMGNCSVMTVPINVFGRPWGVIEIVGLRTHQFLPSVLPWLDEVSHLMGPDFYVQGILNDLFEISQSVLDDKPKEEQLSDVLRWLARIFVAGSGALYLPHDRRTAEFVCVSFFGRPGDQDNGGLSGFNIEDEVSKGASILRSKGQEWMPGVIGQAPFDGEWSNRTKTQLLKDSGYKYIAMMPLKDGAQEVIGCIALAAREGDGFDHRFRHLAEFVTNYAGVAIDAIKLKHKPDESQREFAAHSLKNRVARVRSDANSLIKLLDSFHEIKNDSNDVASLLSEIATDIARRKIPMTSRDRSGVALLDKLQQAFESRGQNSFVTILNDLQEHNAHLHLAAAYLAGDSKNEENPFETTEKQWSGTATALRDCLLGCVTAISRDRGGVIRTPPPQQLGSEVRVRVPALLMSDIINNFCDNAIKYSRGPSSIVFRRGKGVTTSPAYLEFRNLAPPLLSDEKDKLFEMTFRGDYAVARHPNDGQGRGLLSSRKVADRWGMKVYHREEPPEKESITDVWHVFGVLIPSALVFDDPTI